MGVVCVRSVWATALSLHLDHLRMENIHVLNHLLRHLKKRRNRTLYLRYRSDFMKLRSSKIKSRVCLRSGCECIVVCIAYAIVTLSKMAGSTRWNAERYIEALRTGADELCLVCGGVM